jgi:hypothetical protein
VDLHWLFTSFRPTLTESGQQVRGLAGDILGPIEMLGKVNVSMVPNSGTLPKLGFPPFWTLPKAIKMGIPRQKNTFPETGVDVLQTDRMGNTDYGIEIFRLMFAAGTFESLRYQSKRKTRRGKGENRAWCERSRIAVS